MSALRPTAWVVGTFDTKAAELNYLAGLLRAAGVRVVTVDIGTRGAPGVADIEAGEVARHHPQGASVVFNPSDRGEAVIAMGEALAQLVRNRLAAGEIQGMLGVGGSGGSSMIAPAMRLLPIGVPKLLVSTMAAGDVSAYVGVVDMTLMYPVTDIAGLNRLSRTILANAAHALAGMLQHRAPVDHGQDKPSIGLTMFGVTTPCVQAVRGLLNDEFDAQVFHANGAGVCDAGPNRLDAAAVHGLPWVGSVGALDMINWGARDTVPARHEGRTFHVHNANVTLMRSNATELEAAAHRMTEQLNRAPGPVRLLLPLGGVSMIDAPGQPFHDPVADSVLFDTLERLFVPSDTHRLIKLPHHINDPAFATAVAEHVRVVAVV